MIGLGAYQPNELITLTAQPIIKRLEDVISDNSHVNDVKFVVQNGVLNIEMDKTLVTDNTLSLNDE